MEPTTDHRHLVLRHFPFLNEAPAGVRDDLFEAGGIRRLDSGRFVCMEGNACTHIPLVLDGRARVYKTSDTGREITLYRIDPGQTCILTASCILSGNAFPAFAVAEGTLAAFLVPAADFRRWMDRHAAWRTFVFDLLARRLSRVIQVVEEVAFLRMDARVAGYLVQRLPGDAEVLATTHEAIAADLGSSREVVSRLLKEFEHRGLVDLGRGRIRVLDPDGLRAVSREGGIFGGRAGLKPAPTGASIERW